MSFFKPSTALAVATIAMCQAQTRVDLRTQSKSIDFSSASSTKPSQTGSSLPATCSGGQTFLNTTAQPGQNWYVCTAANVWTVQGGIGTGTYSTNFASVTSVTVPGTTHQLGTAKLIVGLYDNGSPASVVEPDSVMINPTTYDVLVKFATPQSGTIVLSAAGGSTSGDSGGAYFSGTATLVFPSIPPAGCASDLTFALTGAAVGDSVAGGWPGSLPNGLLGMMLVSAPNTIAVRLCNFSGGATTPPAATYRATIVRGF
jgi:hypothetical protein